MADNESVQTIDTKSRLKAYHVGPSLDSGPLPTLIYFSLSGDESLTLDPFNQPIAFLAEVPIRKISFTLPYHGHEYPTSEAIGHWAQDLEDNKDFITPFIDETIAAVEGLISEGLIDGGNIAAAGLSRGGFIACHLAARMDSIKTILGFAPLTQFGLMTEFLDRPLSQVAKSLALTNITEPLIGKNLRFYIGNRDTRVGTPECFEFIHQLTEASFAARHRSPPVELIISPSIGHKGHGTGPETFRDGANWVAGKLL